MNIKNLKPIFNLVLGLLFNTNGQQEVLVVTQRLKIKERDRKSMRIVNHGQIGGLEVQSGQMSQIGLNTFPDDKMCGAKNKLIAAGNVNALSTHNVLRTLKILFCKLKAFSTCRKNPLDISQYSTN